MGLAGYGRVLLTVGESPELGDEAGLLIEGTEESDTFDGLGVSMGGVISS